MLFESANWIWGSHAWPLAIHSPGSHNFDLWQLDLKTASPVTRGPRNCRRILNSFEPFILELQPRRYRQSSDVLEIWWPFVSDCSVCGIFVGQYFHSFKNRIPCLIYNPSGKTDGWYYMLNSSYCVKVYTEPSLYSYSWSPPIQESVTSRPAWQRRPCQRSLARNEFHELHQLALFSAFVRYCIYSRLQMCKITEDTDRPFCLVTCQRI